MFFKNSKLLIKNKGITKLGIFRIHFLTDSLVALGNGKVGSNIGTWTFLK